jgi:putative FmdB family regulatory protein
MPFYEYQCEQCGQLFEELVRSMTATPKVACPSCGSKKTVQQLSVFSAQKAAAPSGSPKPNCATCSDGSCPYAAG